MHAAFNQALLVVIFPYTTRNFEMGVASFGCHVAQHSVMSRNNIEYTHRDSALEALGSKYSLHGVTMKLTTFDLG